MLQIRRFVKGVDEQVWVEVLNATYKEYGAWWMGVITVEEMLEEEKRPNFDFEGRFIAELDGKPVGIVHAYVDKLREEKKGWISAFRVMPEFRGRGVEERLLESAMDELKKRGMDVALAGTVYTRNDRIQFLEEHGFKLVGVESDMEIDLASIPSSMSKNEQVTLRLLRKNMEEDIKLLNWLYNECFKEQRGYRPRTIEETRHSLLSFEDMSAGAQQECFFALLSEKNVGFIRVGIDEKRNIEKNVKSGVILQIGVLKPYRRKGIGARLMLHGLETLKAEGMTNAMINVDEFDLTNPIKLYKKVGFHIVNKYLDYEKNLT